MPWIQPNKKKRWHEFWTLRIAAVLLVLGFIAARPLMRRYDRWSAKRSLQRAKEFHAKHDYQHAILDARRALDVNPNDPDAIRIVAEVLEAAGSPQAQMWRARLDSIQPGDPNNLIAWAMGAADTGDWTTAGRVIQSLKPADQASARYHEVAARIAAHKNDNEETESHWAEAVRFDSKEDRYRLNLARVRLPSKDPDVRAGALKVVEELSQKGSRILEARRLLLEDAPRIGDPVRTRGLADSLVATPGATFTDKLARLTFLRRLQGRESARYLLELREAANSNPADLAQLLSWMNRHELAMMVTEWTATLAPEVVSKPPVCVPVAEAYMKAVEWKKLRAIVEKGNWMELDFLRRAFLARALERLGEPDAGTAEWKQALSSASGSRDGLQRLDRLVRVASEWGWESRTEDLLWKMAAYDGCPPWVSDTLSKITSRRGDTAQLHNLSRIIAKARPKDLAARNNYIFLSLLTRTEEGDPQKAAEALYKEARENPAVASTHALSLYQQGRAAEAVAAMKALKPEELRDPQVALYYGIVLMASKQAGEAKPYLDIGGARTLLPEEKALVARVTAAALEKPAKPAEGSPDSTIKTTTPDAPKDGAASGQGKQ